MCGEVCMCVYVCMCGEVCMCVCVCVCVCVCRVVRWHRFCLTFIPASFLRDGYRSFRRNCDKARHKCTVERSKP